MNDGRPAPDAPRRGPDDRGSVAAEFAVVVPVLLLLLFAMITLASLYFDQLRLQSAARDAARVGSVSPAEACSTAETALSGNDVGTLTCTIVDSCSSGALRVRLVARQNLTIPVIGSRELSLDASSSFVCPQ